MLTYLIPSYDSCLSNSKRFILNGLQYRIILSDLFSTTYGCERGVDSGSMGGGGGGAFYKQYVIGEEW